MKKTTYMMLGAMVAGLIGTCAVALAYRHHCITINRVQTLGGEEVKVGLPDVNKVILTEEWPDVGVGVSLNNFKGISVEESDTAKSSTLVTSADWLPLLNCQVDSGTLDLAVDYNAIVERYLIDKRSEYVRCKSDNFVIAKVIVPSGTLKEVEAMDKTIYLDSVKAKEIISKVNYRLVLNNCDIQLLKGQAKRMDELKLDNSKVGEARLNVVDERFTVKCSQDSSVIGLLYINGIYCDEKKAYFNFEKANIKEFKYNPDKETVLNISMKNRIMVLE